MAAESRFRSSRRPRMATPAGERAEELLRLEQMRIQQLETYAADLRNTYSELRRTLQRMTVLHEVSMRITAALDPQDVAATVLDSVAQLVPSESARLYLDDYARTADGHAAPTARKRMRMAPAEPSSLVVRTAEEGAVHQALTQGLTYLQDAPLGGSDLAVPLRAGGQVFGALVLHVAALLPAADMRLVEQLTAIAGVALQNAYLYQETQRLATTDPLTSLSNYRAFVQALDLEVQRARRMGYWLGLLMLDMDHFKDVNDRLGHPTGDEALRRVANVLRRQLRRTDVIGRLGGEEFAVLLPGATLANVHIVGEKLREAVATLPPLTNDLDAQQLTLSVGGAALPPGKVEAQLLVGCADQALYRAKHNGRNQVHLWTEEPALAVGQDDSGSALSRFEPAPRTSSPRSRGSDAETHLTSEGLPATP